MLVVDEKSLPELIEEIRNNNTTAFKEFFSRYQSGIYYFLFRYTSDPEAAKDLTQETFIKFWNHKESINNDLAPKAYLYKIARNLALNYIDRKPPFSSFEENESVLIKLSNNPQLDYERLFLLDECQKAINLLPERCKATFILSVYEGLHYDEIAEVLNVSLQTVKNQMNKAFTVLRKHMSKYID
ncbi:MAG TPA: RNA polymerase sigma-70 factor [Ignavibacteriaceae bacterium]|nr:RNA polymerase sigma-70 factor [Ignavibacteriaceae bacterium]